MTRGPSTAAAAAAPRHPARRLPAAQPVHHGQHGAPASTPSSSAWTTTSTAALLFIVLAAALDSVDGRIARMTGTESEFGKEYDSLADVITFGAAPGDAGLPLGAAGLQPGRLAALRLLHGLHGDPARPLQRADPGGGQPLLRRPALALGRADHLRPALLRPEYTGDNRVVMQAVMGVALLVVGSLMVSTFRYNSFKKLRPPQALELPGPRADRGPPAALPVHPPGWRCWCSPCSTPCRGRPRPRSRACAPGAGHGPRAPPPPLEGAPRDRHRHPASHEPPRQGAEGDAGTAPRDRRRRPPAEHPRGRDRHPDRGRRRPPPW